MKLPNPHRAIIDMRKLMVYCLDPTHSEGKHKARVFKAALGLTSENADELRSLLLNAVQNEAATPTKRNKYGQKYCIDFTVTRLNRQACIRSIWIIRNNEDFPRLVSCYIP